MPTISLTQRAVDALRPPPSGRVEYFDRTLPGFGLRITDAGRKTWIAMYRVGATKVRETIGTVAAIPNVADARKRARESIELAQRGVHPVHARKAAALADVSFNALADRYLAEYVERNTRPKTIRETRRIIERDVKPVWADRPARRITRQDVNDLLDDIAGRGALVQANRTLARLKTLFSWALDGDFIEADPTARVRPRVKEVARDRALSEDEIRFFWSGCDRLGWPFGPALKLLLITAQRREEVASMEWSELDLEKRLWTIPRHKAKNDRAHQVYLSDVALEIITELPRIDPPRTPDGDRLTHAEYVFTTTGRTPVSGFSRAKVAVDEHMLGMLRAEREQAGHNGEAVHLASWIIHDLRRTAATGMARLNVSPHVVDRILNHVAGTIRGVAAVYNRHAYSDERKAALESWGLYVAGLTRPISSNVVKLRGPRS